jgi:hypothetical protein
MKTTTAKIIGAAENFDFLQSLRDGRHAFKNRVACSAKSFGYMWFAP